jgi:hypothetical protein
MLVKERISAYRARVNLRRVPVYASALFLLCAVLSPSTVYASCGPSTVFPQYGIRVAVCQTEARPGLLTVREQQLLIMRTGTQVDVLADVTVFRLSRVFAGGTRAFLAQVLDVDLIHPFGSGAPVFVLDQGGAEFLTWFVESTDLGRAFIDYTHVPVRDDHGAVVASQQYAAQYIDGVPSGVDRTTRRFSGPTVRFDPRESRLSMIEPRRPVVFVRSRLDASSRITDALTDAEDPLDGRVAAYPVLSIGWHSDTLYYHLDLGRGESGWVPAESVRWVQ